MRKLDVPQLVRRHNQLAILRGLGWLVLAVVTWFLSWELLFLLFAVLTFLWGQVWDWTPSWRLCTYAAWIGTVMVAVDGGLYAKKLFDVEEYDRSLYYRFSGSPAIRAVTGNPMGIAYVLTQILFVAPRSTVRAFQAFRSLIFLAGDRQERMVRLVGELGRRRTWVPASTLADAGSLCDLHRLGILWNRVKDGSVDVRLDPAFVNTYFGPTL